MLNQYYRLNLQTTVFKNYLILLMQEINNCINNIYILFRYLAFNLSSTETLKLI